MKKDLVVFTCLLIISVAAFFSTSAPAQVKVNRSINIYEEAAESPPRKNELVYPSTAKILGEVIWELAKTLGGSVGPFLDLVELQTVPDNRDKRLPGESAYQVFLLRGPAVCYSCLHRHYPEALRLTSLLQ